MPPADAGLQPLGRGTARAAEWCPRDRATTCQQSLRVEAPSLTSRLCSDDVLQTKAAGIKCLKALLAAQLAIRTYDVLQCWAAGTQCTRRLKAFNADQLAIRTFDVLPTWAASTP